MAAADLVVARSGGSVAELAALGQAGDPGALSARDGRPPAQERASGWSAGGAALLVDDAELERRRCSQRLVGELLGDDERLAAMAAASAALGRPDATQRVVDEIEDILKRRGAR